MRATALADLQVVQHQDTVLEKPSDADDAQQMLAALSGSAHMVHTGVALVVPQAEGEEPRLSVPSAGGVAAGSPAHVVHTVIAGRRGQAHERTLSIQPAQFHSPKMYGCRAECVTMHTAPPCIHRHCKPGLFVASLQLWQRQHEKGLLPLLQLRLTMCAVLQLPCCRRA